jgi:hypothetical protein
MAAITEGRARNEIGFVIRNCITTLRRSGQIILSAFLLRHANRAKAFSTVPSRRLWHSCSASERLALSSFYSANQAIPAQTDPMAPA